MKVMILALVGFGVGSAGGVFVVSRQPPPIEPTTLADDSTVAGVDTVTVASTDTIVTGPIDSAIESTGTPLDSTADSSRAILYSTTDSSRVPLDSTAVRDSATTPAPTPVATVPEIVQPAPVIEPSGPTAEEVLEAEKTVARIIGQMKPDEAALVIGGMSDDEAESLFRNLGTRKAAMLLASLPRERAAALARRLMVPQGNES